MTPLSLRTLAGSIARHVLVIVATALVGAFLASMLVRTAPGFDVDVQQLDGRLSHETVEALRWERAQNRNIMAFYWRYLRGALHGDLGRSQMLSRPVRELLAERLPVTLRLVAFGLFAGWIAGTALAMVSALVRLKLAGMLIAAAAGALLCIPCAVLALGFVFVRAPAHLAIALVILPKVFAYTRNLLAHSYTMPHIITARAKGINELRVLLWHVLPVTGRQLVALAGVSVSLALGAAIPVEALCGIPGIGQLAWQAALGRDLPVLVTLTLIVALITISANSAASLTSIRAGART